MALRMASVPLAGSLCSVTGVQKGSVCRRRVRIDCGASNVPRNGKVPATAALKPAADAEEKTNALPGLVFEPLREVQGQVTKLQKNLHDSLARQRFQVSCETAINEQINVEYNVSYIYHALFSYFDRDNVALPGLAKYFKDSSDEERQHAEMFMKYQNKRGGRVQLQSIILPPMDFANEEKGDALYAMELTLALEKLTTEKLYDLHKAAEDANDVQLQDYVESEFLSEQVEAIKIVSEYVSQLRRIGNDGHGVYHWDRVLLEEIAKPAVPAAQLGVAVA